MNGSGGGGPPRRRPAVANPYLKRAHASNDARAPGTATPAPKRGANGASAASKTPAAKHARASAAQAPPRAMPSHPSKKGASAMSAVTPTPKKGRVHQQLAAPTTKAASAGARVAPRSAASGTPRAAVQHATITPKQPARRQPPVKGRPTTLKSQLKSQIAQLHRQKKQFLQQKEAERQRLIQQKEMEKQRILKEREMKRQAKLREQQRLKHEEEMRHQLVGKCINDMVQGVERRMDLEKKSGVHYAIGEAVEGIVGAIEQRAEGEAGRKREQLRRAREAEEKQKMATALLFEKRNTFGQMMNHPLGTRPMLREPTPSTVMDARMKEELQRKLNAVAAFAPPHVQSLQQQMGQRYPNGVYGHPTWAHQQHAIGYSHGYSMPYTSMPMPQPMIQARAARNNPPKPVTARKSSSQSAKATMGLHPHPLGDLHSPYRRSHHVVSTDIILTKKSVGQSFGVTLRYECKGILVPREENIANSSADATAAASACALQRVDFGVLVVVNAERATFAGGIALQPGDIVLSVNGQSIGGTSFAHACKAIGSSTCSDTGLIKCALRVARTKALQAVSPTAKPIGVAANGVQNPALPAMIPFDASGKVVLGQFSMAEWSALIKGLSALPHQLFSGLALIPVSIRDVLDAIKKSKEYGASLALRSIDAMEAKLVHESKQIASEMGWMAGLYWAQQKGGDAQEMTDAQRSMRRGRAQPNKGCKCGSLTHEHVDHPDCLLYADVRQYCQLNNITVQAGSGGAKKTAASKNIKAKNAMEKAYIERYKNLRAESAAARDEAEFVLEMEKIQSSSMEKAVFAPSSLCTMVLSAVASMADLVPRENGDDGAPEVMSKQETTVPEQSDSDSDDSDSDDDDAPLNSLVQLGGSKRASKESDSPVPKRAKQTNAPDSKDEKKAAPSPYILAEILKRVSKTHGHLFQEPSHSDYAWQQRHRSKLTTPLSKEVMFKGNPREPGSLSFENIRFMLDEERMSRLRQASQNPNQQQQYPQNDKDALEKWNDEWIVSHLSSDAVTGLGHEINVLVGLEILSVSHEGSVVLADGWQRRIPQLVLNEMRDEWGPDADTHNLYCIHDGIKSTLHEHWEDEEDGWRLASDDDEKIDGDELVFDDDEYALRKQIFAENYSNWVSEKSGQGNFGV